MGAMCPERKQTGESLKLVGQVQQNTIEKPCLKTRWKARTGTGLHVCTHTFHTQNNVYTKTHTHTHKYKVKKKRVGEPKGS